MSFNSTSSSQALYGIAQGPTPLFNTPDILLLLGGQQRAVIPLDSQRLLRAVESVAFPGSTFIVLEQLPNGICRVKTDEYPSQEVFVDQRFLTLTADEPAKRDGELPAVHTILAQLNSLIGTRYIWGGNWPSGIPSLCEYYPPGVPFSQLDPLIADTWQLKGVDCSGLLYYVTNGKIPRNTSDLLRFGYPVSIQGKSREEVIKELKALDLIVWKGHVVIVIDENWTIESLVGQGVIKRPLIQRMEEIYSEHLPVDDYAATENLGKRFVIRRWIRQAS